MYLAVKFTCSINAENTILRRIDWLLQVMETQGVWKDIMYWHSDLADEGAAADLKTLLYMVSSLENARATMDQYPDRAGVQNIGKWLIEEASQTVPWEIIMDSATYKEIYGVQNG